MEIALTGLQLERLAVVYPGATRYPIPQRIAAVPLAEPAVPGALLG